MTGLLRILYAETIFTAMISYLWQERIAFLINYLLILILLSIHDFRVLRCFEVSLELMYGVVDGFDRGAGETWVVQLLLVAGVIGIFDTVTIFRVRYFSAEMNNILATINLDRLIILNLLVRHSWLLVLVSRNPWRWKLKLQFYITWALLCTTFMLPRYR